MKKHSNHHLLVRLTLWLGGCGFPQADRMPVAGKIFLFRGGHPQLLQGGEAIQSMTHRIHVWYIYLHLVDFHGKCRYIYHTWMLWVSVYVVRLWQFISKVLYNFFITFKIMLTRKQLSYKENRYYRLGGYRIGHGAKHVEANSIGRIKIGWNKICQSQIKNRLIYKEIKHLPRTNHYS